MMRAGWIALLAAAIAVATWAGGWSAVPLVAFLWGAWRREHSRAPLATGVAGVVAWGGLLAISAMGSPVLAVADRVGGLAGVPGAVIVMVMLLFAFGLGWSAAEVGRYLMQMALRGRVTD